MKAWILIISMINGQTQMGTKFNSYEACRKEGIKICSKAVRAIPACRKERPFIP
jgi:hypothetical protein